MDGSKTEEFTGTEILGTRPRKEFSLVKGQYATIFQTEVFLFYIKQPRRLKSKYTIVP